MKQFTNRRGVDENLVRLALDELRLDDNRAGKLRWTKRGLRKRNVIAIRKQSSMRAVDASRRRRLDYGFDQSARCSSCLTY